MAQRPLQSCHSRGRLTYFDPHGLDVTEDLLLMACQGHAYPQQVPRETGREKQKQKFLLCAVAFTIITSPHTMAQFQLDKVADEQHEQRTHIYEINSVT